MATRHPGKIGLWALWFSPLVIVPALLALLPWVENDWIAAVFGIYVMGYSAFLAARVNRRLDEVQIAGQRFATTKAMTIGTFAAALVMLFPPSMNALVDLANTLANTLDAGSPDKAVKVGIVFGLMLVVLMQSMGLFAVSIWWGRRIYGGGHDMQADIDMKNRIRILRAEKRWSQSELAERVRVSRNSINAIENGRFDPSLPLAFRIAAAFGLSVEEVFDKTDA